MRQTLWSISLIVCALTVGLVAQAPNSSAPPASKQVTFSGCVEKAPSDEASPPAAAPASSAQFILTNATATAAGAVGTAGSKPAPKYRLDVDDAKITPHVGHKVEVTGTLEEQPGSAGGATASAASGPKLKVDSVKMIAASCK